MEVNDLMLLEVIDLDSEPLPDIAICSGCHWEGPVCKCEVGQEGDWESGYYSIYLCPQCDESEGCIDDFYYSRYQMKKLRAWEKRQPEVK